MIRERACTAATRNVGFLDGDKPSSADRAEWGSTAGNVPVRTIENQYASLLLGKIMNVSPGIGSFEFGKEMLCCEESGYNAKPSPRQVGQQLQIAKCKFHCAICNCPSNPLPGVMHSKQQRGGWLRN